MKFNELSEYLQLNIIRSCKLNKELNGYTPKLNDRVIVRPGSRTGVLKVEKIFSNDFILYLENNNIISVNNA